jgi:ribosomal protein L22
LTRSSCFSPKKAARTARKERRNASNNAEHALLDEAVELATNEWNALGVTDM